MTADVGQASRRCDVLIHLQKESLVIDITRACRLMHTPAERRRLFDVKEREKFNAYPPLAPGKRLVPLVLNDLGGVNEMGMAALRAIAKEGARSTAGRRRPRHRPRWDPAGVPRGHPPARSARGAGVDWPGGRRLCGAG